MTNDTKQWCVLIPCSATETWAVPQNCLAEIMTLNTDTALPPDEVTWRGRTVPVLDFGSDDGSLWREPHRGAGLVAIFLGLRGEGCEYWGVAVRGEGLRVVGLSPEEVEDEPERASQHATAAFNFNGVLCQVPDLDSFQKKIAVTQQVA
jgi:hypothetical protein